MNSFASTGQQKKSGPSEKRYGAGHGLNIFGIYDPLKPVYSGLLLEQ